MGNFFCRRDNEGQERWWLRVLRRASTFIATTIPVTGRRKKNIGWTGEDGFHDPRFCAEQGGSAWTCAVAAAATVGLSVTVRCFMGRATQYYLSSITITAAGCPAGVGAIGLVAVRAP